MELALVSLVWEIFLSTAASQIGSSFGHAYIYNMLLHLLACIFYELCGQPHAEWRASATFSGTDASVSVARRTAHSM